MYRTIKIIILVLILSGLTNAQQIPFSNFKSAYDPDAVIYFAHLPDPFPDSLKTIINTFIVGLKRDTLWTKLDVIVPIGNNTNNNSLWDLKNYKHPTASGTIAFVALNGFTSNGSTGYINTHYNPYTDSIYYSINSSAFGCYIRTNVKEAGVDMGSYIASPANFNFFYGRYTNDALYYDINGNTLNATANLDSRGLFGMNRIDNTHARGNKNGTSLLNGSSTSTAIPNLAIYVCAVNSSGSAGFFSTKQIFLYFIGSGLTPFQMTMLYNDIQAFATSYGANV